MAKKPSRGTGEQMSSAVSDNDFLIEANRRYAKFKRESAESNRKFAESFIKRLLQCKGIAKNLSTMDILRLAWLSKELFTEQGCLIEIDGPVRICGDLHGQYSDLIRLFAQIGFPPKANYLFLGDYVDRGSHNLETIMLCMAFKVRYPKNFFMLRGNHELRHINLMYGFHEEIFQRREEFANYIITDFMSMMAMMPLCALVGGRILCMHGGIGPNLTLERLRNLTRPFESEEPCLETDILWSDPAKVSGWQSNPRGASVVFGEAEVKQALKTLNIDLIVRGHQVVQDGYEFFAGRSLVTVFSAPHYMGSFTNSAAVCKVSADLEVSFEVLRPESIQVQERNNPEMSVGEPSAAV